MKKAKSDMKLRTIWKDGRCYPQIKRHWYSGWEGLMNWWGNYKEVSDGESHWMMFTDYRVCTTNKYGTPCETEEEAYKHCQDVISQGGVYTRLGIAPTFNDGFSGFYQQLT